MTWFAFKGHPDIELAGAQEKVAVTWGFHGYATRKEADAKPNSVNALQLPILNTLEADYKKAVQEGAQPGGPNAGNPVAAGAAGAGIPNPLAGLEGISKIIGDIGLAVTDGKMWRSLGWLVLGLILLGGGAFMLAKDKGAIPNVVPIPV